MKRIQYIAIAALTTGFMTLQSCLDFDEPTDDFRPNDITIDEGDIVGEADSVNLINYKALYTEEQVDAVAKSLDKYFGMFTTAQYYMCGGKIEDNGSISRPVSHAWQRYYTLPDVYAQYGVVPHSDFAFAGALVSSYNVSPDWIAGPNGKFIGARNCLTPLLNHKSSDSIPEVKAIALLLYNYAAIENVDMYGTIPYNDFKANKVDPPFKYDDMKTIYTGVEANIDTIVNCLRYFDSKPAWYQAKVKDIVNNFSEVTRDDKNGVQNMETWVRFANSLKLRMAMHMVKAEPQLAQKWAEEAVKSGVIDDLKYEVGMFPSAYGKVHPLVEISEVWHDMRFSASFISLLKSLTHPYSFSLCMRNSGNLFNDQGVTLPAETDQVGIRSGIHTGMGQSYGSNQFIGFSRINKMLIENAPLYLFKWAEIDFLRAEGALRGWDMGGKAELFYTRAIENSSIFEPGSDLYNSFKPVLSQYGSVEKPVAYTYKDPTGSSPDMEGVTKIGVKWNEADDKETKLEKIITQKYIALFPNSMEAWGEMRRTGYPKMFPVLNVEEGDGSLKPGDLVRRILFPNSDDASLKDIQATGLKALGGPDQQATRVWWDVKGKGNF
ncbi:SusD/RagB family nutrient-binding outer membrane lipoprotein [Hoylesella timonensis]|uniref:SusD/RagB family nutrient-binding outer membrane lipoprotein n=1 Tax=Hoylesella timonensis TaxID=386414 RepID=UPI002889BF5C|nr:SusD/RagB family nutrient-binding outer membrane lipoprotein [Hoylesella timonensis]